MCLAYTDIPYSCLLHHMVIHKSASVASCWQCAVNISHKRDKWHKITWPSATLHTVVASLDAANQNTSYIKQFVVSCYERFL